MKVLTGCSLIRGHGGDALDFLREAGRSWNVEPGPNHYRLALLSCVRDQSIELVHGIYAMMERYNVSNRFSIEISTVLLQCMYANQQENNRNDLLKQAEEVIVSMKAQHIEPDRSLYNISIQAFSNLGAYQQAMQYFEEMAMSSQQKGDRKYSKRRRSNVAVIIDCVVFISSFLFCCLLLNHSFQTNPNKITNCFKLFSLLQLTTTLLLRRF